MKWRPNGAFMKALLLLILRKWAADACHNRKWNADMRLRQASSSRLHRLFEAPLPGKPGMRLIS